MREASLVSALEPRRSPNKDGMLESRLGIDVGGGGKSKDSEPPSPEYTEFAAELWALLSRLSLPLRLKSDLLKNCTLSGRSFDGMLLDVDRPDDFRDNVLASRTFSHEGLSAEVRDRNEDEPEEWLWCLSRTDARCICLRILSGDGGASMAGPRKLSRLWSMGTST